MSGPQDTAFVHCVHNVTVVVQRAATVYCRFIPGLTQHSGACSKQVVQVLTAQGEALPLASPLGEDTADPSRLVEPVLARHEAPWAERRTARRPIDALPSRWLSGRYYLWESSDGAISRFQPFLVQHAPKLVDYLLLRARLARGGSARLRLLCSERTATPLAHQLLSSLRLAADLVTLADGGRYMPDELWLTGFYSKDSTAPSILSLFRRLQFALRPPPPFAWADTPRQTFYSPGIYLQRDRDPAGALRQRGLAREAANEEELAAALRQDGVESVRLGKASLREKAAVLEGASLIVTPVRPGWIGSNRVGSGRVGSGRVGLGRVGPGRVGSGRIRSDPIRSRWKCHIGSSAGGWDRIDEGLGLRLLRREMQPFGFSRKHTSPPPLSPGWRQHHQPAARFLPSACMALPRSGGPGILLRLLELLRGARPLAARPARVRAREAARSVSRAGGSIDRAAHRGSGGWPME